MGKTLTFLVAHDTLIRFYGLKLQVSMLSLMVSFAMADFNNSRVSLQW